MISSVPISHLCVTLRDIHRDITCLSSWRGNISHRLSTIPKLDTIDMRSIKNGED